MKTSLLVKQNFLNLVLFVSVTFSSVFTQAQSSNELKFENSSLKTGTAGADGAVYLFPGVNNTMDAWVKITGRSSSLVKLSTIDITSTGFSKAFQPQIEYNNGNVSGATNWWMEFEINFMTKNTSNTAAISEAYATGLDIDGDDNKLKEWDAFYGSTSYTVESNTQLTISSVTGILSQLSLLGKKFLGTSTDHSGIDTSATSLMTTHFFQNKNSITIRLGATTTGSANNAKRMYSIWFKNFAYTAPVTTLPVKLISFSAMENNNKVDLKWTTATEINVSHFMVERSTDGTNFSDAGMVFAYGNTTSKSDYAFTDNISNIQSGVIYYRLRSVDVDGKTQYSDIRIIRISKQEKNDITILTYPNPVTNEVRITIPANWQNKKVVYELLNANGQTAKKTVTTGSSQTESMNVSSLNSGLYIVKVTCEGQSAIQKIIKQ
ncbi:MAG: T9SS type A sorting domain-containing protein [Chitinophagaceae bacterium]|nr:T9SS type A sorting domain-containing protein [Chitinophagaceae bacterium]